MVPCARVRGRSVRADLVLMAALLASTLLCSPVAADLAPFPDLAPPTVQEGFFFHVQPVSADFCDQQTIWECSQIRQSTPDTGTLEFDLFVYSKRDDPQMSINGLSLPLEWTENYLDCRSKDAEAQFCEWYLQYNSFGPDNLVVVPESIRQVGTAILTF